MEHDAERLEALMEAIHNMPRLTAEERRAVRVAKERAFFMLFGAGTILPVEGPRQGRYTIATDRYTLTDEDRSCS